MRWVAALSFLLLLVTKSNSQCVADNNCTAAQALCPSSLAAGCVNTPYSETLTFVTPDSVAGFRLQSITLVSLNGLPSGITYNCNPANCVFPASSKNCILVSGTTQNHGIYPLTVTLRVRIYLSYPLLAINYPDTTFAAGSIVINPKDCAGVCSGAASIDNCGICSGGTTGILPDCDDGDDCTIDGCDGIGGCAHQPGGCNITISGFILTETNAPVPGAVVTLTGDDNLAVNTDSTGAYSFSVLPGGNYIVTPAKNNDVNPADGITSLDLVLIQRHALDIQKLSTPYKIIAADGNGSGTITSLDIVQARAIILGNATSFINGRLWEFVKSDFEFSDNLNPFPYEKNRSYTSLNESLTQQNFIGIKLGDVNSNWAP